MYQTKNELVLELKHLHDSDWKIGWCEQWSKLSVLNINWGKNYTIFVLKLGMKIWNWNRSVILILSIHQTTPHTCKNQNLVNVTWGILWEFSNRYRIFFSRNTSVLIVPMYWLKCHGICNRNAARLSE